MINTVMKPRFRYLHENLEFAKDDWRTSSKPERVLLIMGLPILLIDLAVMFIADLIRIMVRRP